MPGHRSDCLYCRKSILSRDRGHHYLKHHKEEIFALPSNLKALHSKNYEKTPLFLRLGDAQKTYTFCLSDLTCFSRSDLAKEHLKKKLEGHLTALKSLREEFPKTWTPQEETENPLTEEERSLLHRILAQVQDKIGLTRKEVTVFKKIGLTADKEELKKMFPHVFQTSREEMEERFAPENAHKLPPSSSPEDDVKEEVEEPVLTVIEEPVKEEPIPPPKTDPRKEMMMNLLEDPDIDEASKNVIRKQLGLASIETKTAPPPPSEPLEVFKKLSGWERFLQANPHYSLPEALMAARNMGIQPDTQYKLISDTKAKRVVKKPDC
jgi:hypothetical protein